MLALNLEKFSQKILGIKTKSLVTNLVEKNAKQQINFLFFVNFFIKNIIFDFTKMFDKLF